MPNRDTIVFWDTFHFQTFRFYLAATCEGIVCMALPNESFQTFTQWIRKHLPETNMMENQKELAIYKDQLMEYFQGKRKVFTCPLDLHGTPFQKLVWQALREIPYGETRSYDEVAKLVQRPKAVRAIGAASGANPLPIFIPCHRVIGKNGTLTGYRGGLEMKSRLLHGEQKNYTMGGVYVEIAGICRSVSSPHNP